MKGLQFAVALGTVLALAGCGNVGMQSQLDSSPTEGQVLNAQPGFARTLAAGKKTVQVNAICPAGFVAIDGGHVSGTETGLLFSPNSCVSAGERKAILTTAAAKEK